MCDGEMTPMTGGGVTITSSANICIIKTFDPFLSFPALGIQNVASFCLGRNVTELRKKIVT